VESIQRQAYPPERIRVIVVEGNQPSVQRNRAAAQATGEVLYFLDDDSVLPEGVFFRGLTWFNDPDVAVVGGPVLTRRQDSFLQQCFGAALGSLFGSFSTRNRFASRGFPRVSGEQQLISANMAVRTQVFRQEGGFNEQLYPNEECEFLNRLRAKCYRLVHDPALQVYRHQRGSLYEFARQVFHYGRGRMEHFWANPRFFNPIFLVPLFFVLYVLTSPLSYSRWGLPALLPLLLYCLLDIVSTLFIVVSRRSPAMLLVLPLLFPVMHASYGFGLAWGLVLCWRKSKRVHMPACFITAVAVSTVVGSSKHEAQDGAGQSGAAR
jgi:cellulose synthase/poly-beta-1,6-N-acetylglucosamine synthase-like glycosyltransferase